MPNRDGTGKDGQGAKSGRQMGNCPGAVPTGRPMDGRGKGMGRVRGKKGNDAKVK